jgi:hypothetical protein
MPMGTGEKSTTEQKISDVERNFHASVKATEKKEEQHAICGSYGRGRKKEYGHSYSQGSKE